MNTYQWSVTNLSVVDQEPYTQVVKSVDFTITVTDPSEQFHSTTLHSVQLVVDQLEGFTPFEQLTEAQVIQWVKNAYSVEQYSSLMTYCDQQLVLLQAAPKPVARLPWADAQLAASLMPTITAIE